MKKYLSGLITGLILALSFTVLAAELRIIPNPYPVLINGTNHTVDGYNINDYTYLKLSDFKKAGLTVKFNETDQQIEITSLNDQIPQNNQLDSTNSITINNITIKINKIIQDSDSLKLYITYSNGSNKQIMSADSLSKIVFNGKQYEYNSAFNFDRYYEKNIKAPDFIEPGVTADSVIFFPPINNANKINVVLNANYQSYRFNNIDVISSLENNIVNKQSVVLKISVDETNKYSDWASTSDLKEKYNIYYTDTLDTNDITKSCTAKIENKNLKSTIEFAMPGYNYKENALYSITIGQNTFLMWTKTAHDYYFRISELKKIGLIT